MEEKEIRAFINAIDRLLGDPLRADANEVEALFAELGEGRDPTTSLLDLASLVAKEYRLRGETVPAHVAAAVQALKKVPAGELAGAPTPATIIDAVLNPISGPVQEVSYAFRNRKERTDKDGDLLERLSDELKKDWSEGDKK